MFLDFQQKRKIRSVLYSKISILILLIIFLYSIYATFLVYKKKSDSENELYKIESEYSSLQLKNNSVSAQTEDLKTEIGMEKEIRNKFGVAKEDESLVMIVNDKKDDQMLIENNISIWQRIIEFIKK